MKSPGVLHGAPLPLPGVDRNGSGPLLLVKGVPLLEGSAGEQLGSRLGREARVCLCAP